jgi:hypothetical protein
MLRITPKIWIIFGLRFMFPRPCTQYIAVVIVIRYCMGDVEANLDTGVALGVTTGF